MIHPQILFNHEILPASDRVLSPGQVGVMNGWGVFSTVKVVDGVLFAFGRHWARMRRDAELLRVPFPWSPAELEDGLLRLVEANGARNSTLRVAVVRNKGTMWEGPGLAREVDLLAFTAERNNWGDAVRLGLVANARHAANVFAGAKIMAWAMNLVWYEEAHLRGFDEVILLNEHQHVSECTSANVFAVFGQEVCTPPLSAGCLPGITRELLLEEVRVPGLRVVERDLTVDDLERADGLFITSSTRDLLAVAAVEGISIRRDDSALLRLLEGYREYEARYVQQAARRAKLAPAAAEIN
jgi:branched-chain amino acid aminotransferase